MPTKQLTTLSKTLPPFIMDGSIASFHYDNWRALHHHTICITWSFCLQFQWWKMQWNPSI